MKKQSKFIYLLGVIFLLGMLILAWKLPQETSCLQEKNRLPDEAVEKMGEWLNPRLTFCMDALLQKTPGTLIFGQFRMAEQTVKTGNISRYQLLCMMAIWYVGLLLPQLTVRGLRGRFIVKSTALWHNIYYIHRGDGKKKLSVAVS